MRSLNRYVNRRLLRHTTRMIAGCPRPRPPDEIAIVCRAIERVLEIDRRLKPFLLEQQRLLENRLFRQECEAALARVYGSSPKPGNKPVNKW